MFPQKPETCRAPPSQYRYEAELTNQRCGSGSKTLVYSGVPHGGAEWWRDTAFCCLSYKLVQVENCYSVGRDHHQGEGNRPQYTVEKLNQIYIHNKSHIWAVTEKTALKISGDRTIIIQKKDNRGMM